jgi:hypothetical protein
LQGAGADAAEQGGGAVEGVAAAGAAVDRLAAGWGVQGASAQGTLGTGRSSGWGVVPLAPPASQEGMEPPQPQPPAACPVGAGVTDTGMPKGG